MRDGKLRNDPEEHQFPIFLVPLEAGDGGDEDMETNLLAGFLMLRDCHTCVPCMFMANCFIPCVLLQDTKAEINAELSYIYIYMSFLAHHFSPKNTHL